MMKRAITTLLAMMLILTLPTSALADVSGSSGIREKTFSFGNSFSAVIDPNGALWMWGKENGAGQIGNGTISQSVDTPVKVLDDVVSVACGYYSTAAITSDASLWMWGDNSNGELGNGGKGNESRSIWGMRIVSQTVPVKVMDDVVDISCGYRHTAAVKSDGSLWMWGYNVQGQLGNATKNDSRVPVKVLDDVVSVECGYNFTAAIKKDGSLWMWGSNGAGQLGNGGIGNSGSDYSDQNVPVKMMDNVAAVSCGVEHAAAIKTDGSLWMWGYNAYGELGNGGIGNSSLQEAVIQTVPVKVMDSVIAVSCGSAFSAAIKTDGSLWMWGNNSNGQLGNGRVGNNTNGGTPIQNVPTKITDDVIAINCSKNFDTTSIIKKDGTLWACGKGISSDVLIQITNLTAKIPATGTMSSEPAAPTTHITEDGFEINDDGVLVKYSGSGGDITIPSSVKSIGYAVFDGCSSLTSVIIPDTVTEITGEAFAHCTKLTSVTIGNGVTTINDNTFSGCTALRNVKIGNNVTKIYIGAFSGCKSLTDITIPDGVTLIQLWAFSGCESLTRVSIPESVTYMDGEVFDGCPALTIHGVKGSYAETYADQNGIPFMADGIPDPGIVGGFNDVRETDYYAEPVLWAVGLEITNGVGNNQFAPGRTCSNAEILTFLWRAAGRPQPSGGNPFNNLRESDYYYRAALWAYESGMITGNSFDANKDCTRAMTVTYIWKANGCPAGSSDTSFLDIDPSLSEVVSWAVARGITYGTGDGKFSPDNTCTRGQIVTFLYRTYAT